MVAVRRRRELGTYTDHVESDTDYRSFASDTAPPDVAFFDSGGGSSATDLPAENHNLVFHRRCDTRQTDEFEFTAEVGAGQFDD